MSDTEPTKDVPPRPQPPAEPRAVTSAAAPSLPAEVAVVPNHKVGRHLVYDKYPAAYDVLMSRHDCSAVQAALWAEARRLLAPTKEASEPAQEPAEPSPSLRVADLGCGTGRLALMLLPWARHLFAADAAMPMVARCVERVAALVPEARPHVYHEGTTPPTAAAAGDEPRSAVMAHCAFEELAPLPEAVAKERGLSPVKCPCAECLAALVTQGEAAVATPPTIGPVAGYALHAGASSGGPQDMVVAGWSLSFVMTAQWGNTRWHDVIFRTIASMAAALDPARGVVAVVETLGNFSEEPVRRNSLHTYLATVLGFTQSWCRTDYVFTSEEEARRLVTFFFGSKVAERLAGTKDPTRLLECTGIWVRRFAPGETVRLAPPAAAAT